MDCVGIAEKRVRILFAEVVVMQDVSYGHGKSLQKDNHEDGGKPRPQNEHYNSKKEALGPNTKRS